jgi:hypothetical protein
MSAVMQDRAVETRAAPGGADAGTGSGVSPVSSSRDRRDPRRRAQRLHFGELLSTVGSRAATLSFAALVIAVIALGWRAPLDDYITPQRGLGYALGIIGGSMMLSLLIYPLRKRVRWMRSLGTVKQWFRSHMMLGVLGPTCILYHCNYHLGATNSNVALFCMLTVAGSGLIGRFIYAKIHHGLYGTKVTLKQLREDTLLTRGRLNEVMELAPGLQDQLDAFEQSVLKRPANVVHGAWRLVTVGARTHLAYWASIRTLRRAFAEAARHHDWNRRERRRYYRDARRYLRAYLGVVRKIAEHSFYERLFALWHVLHLPLFFMLLISGVVHVFAVHVF